MYNKIMKVISFSLWGENLTYVHGAIRCAEQASKMFPGFICWFYVHQETVPLEIIQTLHSMQNVRIIFRQGDLATTKPMMWRFEAIDDPDVEIMMSRDTDTDFLLREQLAVKEWIDSGKTFHIMRDHPHHVYHILGGMFGTRKIPGIPCWKEKMDMVQQTQSRNYDQEFLRDVVYPHIANDSVIHATFHKYEPHCRDFPIQYESTYRFVGEYVYVDGSRSLHHTKELMDAVAYLEVSHVSVPAQPEPSFPKNVTRDILEWDAYFMSVAFLSAMRSKDPHTQVGACIVNPDKRIVGIGYNGFPRRCDDTVLSWSNEKKPDDPLDSKYLYVCHAEVNAILNKNSSDVRNCTLYVALFPCNECAKIIIQSGISEVVYCSDKYSESVSMRASRRMFELANVTLRQYVPKNETLTIRFDQ